MITPMKKSKRRNKSEVVAVFRPIGWRPNPQVQFKGFMLEPFGFKRNDIVKITLEQGKITITPIQD